MRRNLSIGVGMLALLLAAAAALVGPTVGAANWPTCQGEPATISKPSSTDADHRYFFGTEGRDVIVGTNQADYIRGYGGGDLICARGGDDFAYGDGGRDRVDGGDGADYLTGDGGNDVLRGGSGNDELKGEQDDDVCDGGRGTDIAPDTADGPCEQTKNIP